MIISHKKRFILLAPWKTASSTLDLRLKHCNQSPYSRFFDYNPHLDRVVHQHLTYPEFALLPEAQKGYFTGVFVRHPYDRVYSGFLQLQRDIREQPGWRFPRRGIKRIVMAQLAGLQVQLAAADFDFDRWFASLDESQLLDRHLNSSFPLYPVHYWTGIDREQKVDFIGKVETFEPDFAAFCQRVGIVPRNMHASANVSGEAGDSSAPGASRYAGRMNAASISKINALFDLDFELFGYEKLGSAG